MRNQVFQLIDQTADRIRSDLGLVVNSIEGIYSRSYRNDPSPRGLAQFIAETASSASAAERLAHDALTQFQAASLQFLAATDTTPAGSSETLVIAPQQLRTTVESVRLLTARRFKAALVSRSSIAPPSAGAQRVMNRAGQQYQASELFFLTARKATIDLFNEAQIEALRRQGDQVAVVATKDPEHELNGALLAIGDAHQDLPHYADVQDKWFHPRSYALIDKGH